MCALILALAQARDSEALRRAYDAFQRHDWSAAEQACRAAIREQPANADALKLLGMVYVAQQKFRLAEDPLKRACELKPNNDLACYYLGRNYYALGRYRESREVLEQALRNSREGDRVRVGLGLTLEALGLASDAEKCLKQAAASGSREALSEYGQFLFRQGRLKESIPILRRSGNEEALARATRELAAVSGALPAGSKPDAVRFSASTLPMTVNTGGAGEKHQVETMIAGVAVFDYDGDGWPDIYVCNGATIPELKKPSPRYSNRLFHNNRDGTFSDVTNRAGVAGRGYSMGAAAADYDNDGRTDLFVTGVRENILYRNRGDGTFEDVTDRAGVGGGGRWAVAAGWFDYDNDGRLDLFVVRYVVWDPATEPYCGERRPGYRSYCHPRYYVALPNLLYHNEGDGAFRDASEQSGIAKHFGKGMGVAFGDYDGDGFEDVFVANDTTPNFLFHNLGNGTFEEVALAKGVAYNGDGRADSTMGADFRDYDNDGREDIFTTALSNEGFTLWRNLGRGFSEVTQAARLAGPTLPLAGWSTGLFDFNNDGFKDIFTANGHADDNVELTSSLESRQPNAVFVNRGDGAFELCEVPGKALHRGAAFGDFNRDGRIDVVVTRLGDAPLVLMNTTSTRNHWLEVRLHGRRSNRDGIGARIRAVTEAGSQWNHVTTSVGYAGSSEPVVHFGLGRNALVRELDIRWPSGAQQRLRDVAADQRLDIEESR
jgi:tetratricopeptide (TPR) repeat protein